MKYSELRHNIRNGDVLLFSKGNGLFSQFIEWWTDSAYCHVGIAFWITGMRGRLAIIEAVVNTGVRIHFLSHYLEQSWHDGYEVELFQLNRQLRQEGSGSFSQKIVDYALAQEGKPYASWQDLFLTYIVPEWVRVPRNIDGNKRYYCSKLVADSLKHAGWGNDTFSENSTPAQIASLSCFDIPYLIDPDIK